MIPSIVIGGAVLIWTGINLARMVKNAKAGKSIDGCDGNCSHCHGCKH